VVELAISLGVIAIFAAIVVAAAFVPLLTLIAVGYWMVAIGLLAGVPGGIGYHVEMHRGLRGTDAGAWWWSPVRHHGRLNSGAWRRVQPWFLVGVVGATTSLAGCALLVVCLVRLG
jgi:hypothetical protein